MLRSLFSAISGLRANQTMLDVTGNNIANANTAGFKASTVVFQDTLSQMLTGASAPNANRGGTNPIEVGLGVQVGGTAINFGQGSTQTTGRDTNLMISGDGFFVVDRGGVDMYTRAGAFKFDALGNLVNLDGDVVQGLKLPATGTPTTTENIRVEELAGQEGETDKTKILRSYSIGADGVITGVFADGHREDMFQVALANFANPAGLQKAGDTAFLRTPNSGDPQIGAPGSGRLGTLMGSSLEMSNVDLAQEFTNLIIAQRGFQATSRVITTSDQVLEELVNIKR
jgi:flagellar hook protein FlgE